MIAGNLCIVTTPPTHSTITDAPTDTYSVVQTSMPGGGHMLTHGLSPAAAHLVPHTHTAGREKRANAAHLHRSVATAHADTDSLGGVG